MPSELSGPPSATSTHEISSPFDEPPSERADAARNRQRILNAAARLFAEHGVGAVTMDAVAAAAGVGKGTLFRRFGDKAGLAVALLDSAQHQLHKAVLSGPPPLGPGAEPTERILAFLHAYRDLLESSTELLLMSETASPGARYRVGAYRFWHQHLVTLLRQRDPDLDAVALAHALLAPLSAELYVAQRERGLTADRLIGAVVDIARALLQPAAQPVAQPAAQPAAPVSPPVSQTKPRASTSVV
jgi:AcrR family transcriptional regulator